MKILALMVAWVIFLDVLWNINQGLAFVYLIISLIYAIHDSVT